MKTLSDITSLTQFELLDVSQKNELDRILSDIGYSQQKTYEKWIAFKLEHLPKSPASVIGTYSISKLIQVAQNQ